MSGSAGRGAVTSERSPEAGFWRAAAPERPRSAAGRWGVRYGILVSAALACLIEDFASSVPIVPGVAGLWLVFGATTAVWYGSAARLVSTREAAAIVALCFALITDMVVLLAVNELLPMAGIAHPLARVPIAVTLAATVVLLGAMLPEADPDRLEPWRIGRSEKYHREGHRREMYAVGALGLVCLVLSVAGPIRLNNGFGPGVSIAGMVCATALAVWLLARAGLSQGTVALGLYCVALALLLLTSLRGWSITGHDIQREYAYFQLAFGDEHWNIRQYSNPYNACLSITLLPVAVAKLTAIPGVFVFKAVIPALFAAAPVAIYRAARNVAPQRIAVLSALIFVTFPTYFTDMPYLGRQEVAFVLLGAAVLLVTERDRPLRARRLAFAALAIGLALSHYSTTYVFVIVLALAVAVDLGWRAGSWYSARGKRSGGRARPRARRAPGRREPGFVVWWLVPIAAGFALLWAGPLTGTGGQLHSTLVSAIQDLSGTGGDQSGSSGVSYSVFGGQTETDQQRLADYRDQMILDTGPARQSGAAQPAALVGGLQTPLVAPEQLPLTSLGSALTSAGINVTGLNGLARGLVAYLLQGLIVLGLAAMWLFRRRGFEPLRDQVTLTIGALGMLAALTLIPQLSVDYSVLRGFQQGIFFFAPFMALGLVWALSWLRRWTVPAVCAATAVLLLDLTGVLPRATGGDTPKLSLANSGQYYDVYEPTAAEQSAARWLETRISTSQNRSGTLVQTDAYTYARLQTILTSRVKTTIYPLALNTNSPLYYVLLGTTTTKTGDVTIYYRGDLVTYRYPTSLFDVAYNEIYTNGGAEILQ